MNPNGGVAAPFSAWERTIASRYLRNKRKNGGIALISIISFVGITLAVFALITVMSVMNGFRSELLSRILGFNGHVYVAGEVLANGPRRDAAVARIRQVPGVIQVTPMIEAQTIVLGHGQVTGAMVRGVSPEDLRRTKIVADNIRKGGSLAEFGKGDDGGDTILMGSRLADQLGVQAGDPVALISPSGQATAFGSTATQKDYIVGGLFTVGMSEYDQTFIYMPFAQAQPFFGKDQGADVIEIKLADPDKAQAMTDPIRQAAGPGALVMDWTQKNQTYFNALKVERNVMRLILMLLVAIAALNIISGLVMLVKNKGRDIAILRTMGAGQGAILRIFFMAGASIGVLGTLSGLVLGTLFCIFIGPIQKFVEAVTRTQVFDPSIYFLAHIPAKVDWSEVAIITFWSLLMSFICTLPPAWRASRLDPVEALRYE